MYPLPLLKKNRLYKVSEAELSLKQMSDDFKIIYTACPILPYIEYDELLYPLNT